MNTLSNIQNNPLLMALTAAVLNPGLRTILVYDAPYDGLQQIASYLSAIERALGHEIVTTQLGSSEHDDNLWGSISLPGWGKTAHPKIQHKPLIFSPPPNKEQLELLLIPNLAEISLTVARAAIMVMGTSVVHLERNRESAKWQPQHYWIASCKQDEIGSVSSHLVDRFALRLRWNDAAFSPDHQIHLQQLKQSIANTSGTSNLSAADHIHIQSIVKLITKSQKHQPQTTPESITVLLDYFTEDIPVEQLYHRHEITLARYAVAVAQIASADHVDERHIAQAAMLMGIRKKETTTDNTSAESIETDEQGKKVALQQPEIRENSQQRSTVQQSEKAQTAREKKEQITVEMQKETITPLMQSILTPDNAYLEDSEVVLREEDSLRLPLRCYMSSRADHGSIIGIEKGSSLRDIAIVSTILHAVLFSKLRQISNKQAESMQGIRITLEDLHHYRRMATPEYMLLLVLDYTSLKHTNWQEALLPYLSLAYIRRASISIVKVGAQDAQHELQAEVISARNMLVPSIGHALEIATGRATPLAHGLRLALQALQHNLQHGRNTVQNVMLVVISDGRGNIPLQASINKRVTTLVAQEGIGDTLEIAQEIRQMKHVERIMLNPQPTHYVQLPIMLADALGATIEPIPLASTETEIEQEGL